MSPIRPSTSSSPPPPPSPPRPTPSQPINPFLTGQTQAVKKLRKNRFEYECLRREFMILNMSSFVFDCQPSPGDPGDPGNNELYLMKLLQTAYSCLDFISAVKSETQNALKVISEKKTKDKSSSTSGDGQQSKQNKSETTTEKSSKGKRHATNPGYTTSGSKRAKHDGAGEGTSKTQ